MSNQLTLKLLKDTFCVCKMDRNSVYPEWILKEKWYSVTKTDDEMSIVCREEIVPNHITRESDWKCFKIEGVLDFSLVGILASISTIMAKAAISIFAISTYNTDYIFIKTNHVEKAIEELKNNHMKVVVE